MQHHILFLQLHMQGKEIFYLMHSTHFIYSYVNSDMVEDHADNERKPAATTFQLAARDILYLHRQESISMT